MLNWFSSFFSGKRKLEIKTEGSFIRYVYGKTPRTIAVDTTLYLCPNLNDDEFVIKIEGMSFYSGNFEFDS